MGYLPKLAHDDIQNIPKYDNRTGLCVMLSFFIALLLLFQSEPVFCQNWTASTIRMLPDSSFAIVAKDENGQMVQNKYQGNSIQLQFTFEATQWNGLTIKKEHTDKDGYVKENEKAHSEDKN